MSRCVVSTRPIGFSPCNRMTQKVSCGKPLTGKAGFHDASLIMALDGSEMEAMINVLYRVRRFRKWETLTLRRAEGLVRRSVTLSGTASEQWLQRRMSDVNMGRG